MGSGFKDWAAGDVLTAADVDGYLMRQTVMTFADSSARDTALSGVLDEGMVAYLEDTDVFTVYDGSSWFQYGPGKIIAVKHALFTGTQTNSTAGGANFAVTDLSITHTLANSSNKLIISAYFGAAANGEGYGQVGLAVADDGTLIGIGDAAGNRTRVGAGGIVSAASETFVVSMPSVTFVYEPGDTASHTYTVRAINVNTGTFTIYINRNENNNDNANRSRASSGLVIQEVSA